MSLVSPGLAASWAAWFGPMSVQVALLALLVLLLERLVGRRAGSGLRGLLWSAVALKLVLPPTLASPWSVARVVPVGSVLDGAALAGPGLAGHPLGETGAAVGSVPALAALWLVGVVLLTAGGLARHVALLRYAARAGEAPRAAARRSLRRVARRVGLRRVPALRVLPAHAAPVGACVVGVLRPLVLVPAALTEDRTRASRARLEHVLLHELTHLRLRHPAASALCRALLVVYWFHPAAWMMARRLHTLRELACDRAVVRTLGGDPSGYRATLVRLARHLAGGAAAGSAGSLAFARGPSELLERLHGLESAPRPGSPRARVGGALLAGLLLGCCLPLATATPGAAPPPPERATESAAALPSMADARGCFQRRFVVLAHLAAADASPRP